MPAQLQHSSIDALTVCVYKYCVTNAHVAGILVAYSMITIDQPNAHAL